MNRRCQVAAVSLLLMLPWCMAADKAPITETKDSPSAKSSTTSTEGIYKKTPQAELKISLDFPSDWQASDKRPAIVFFFGGGWNNGRVGQFEMQARALADRGLVAARADYRVKSRHQVSPDQCVEDAKSAVRWLRKNASRLGIDPNRIVAAGGSAGGHLAACTSLTTGLEAAGEDLAISSQPNLLVLFNPVLDFSAAKFADRVSSPEIAKQISPTLHLKKETPAALLMFGTEDLLIEQAHAYLKRSKELGNRAELYSAEGERHSFFNRAPWQQRTLDRVDEFLVSQGYLKRK